MNVKIIAALICPLIFMILGCGGKSDTYKIGVIQWSKEIHAFNEAYKGVVDGLMNEGYKEGVNLKIDYQNIEQDEKRALVVAQEFVNKNVNVIVAIGTGSALAALEVTKTKGIPIVYSVVTDPKSTGVIKDYNDSGRNITGISMKIPAKAVFEFVKETLPGIKKLGILYCTEMPQASASGKDAADTSPLFGWEPVIVTFPKKDLSQLEQITNSLAKKVDAIYLPVDPICYSPTSFNPIIRIADAHKIPVIMQIKQGVDAGALIAISPVYYETGKQSVSQIVNALKGVNVQTLPSQDPIIKKISLNLKKAEQLKIQINRNVIAKANDIVQ